MQANNKRTNKIFASKALIYLTCIILVLVILLTTSSCAWLLMELGRNDEPTYYVTNSCFTKTSVIGGAVQGATDPEMSHAVDVSSSCKLSLIQYSLKIDFYNSKDEKKFTFEQTYDEEVAANETIKQRIFFSEKQYAQIDVDSTLVVWYGLSYEDPEDSTGSQPSNPSSSGGTYNPSQDPGDEYPDTPRPANTHIVKLVYNNGNKNKILYVENNKTFSTPDDPVRENYDFIAWYADRNLTKRYDFAQVVKSDTNLYAGYKLDAAKVTNEIGATYMKSVVKIYNESFNRSFFGSGSSTSQGSGFCFHSQNGHYFILTNCHVARKKDGYSYQDITVEDYKGNIYTGYIFEGQGKLGPAIDPAYDLACVYFKSNNTEVTPLPIAANPYLGEDVISVSAPEGQSNRIAFGSVSAYKKIDLSDSSPADSNVKFDVIEHSAFINRGSSGSALINPNGQVVGVNYAGGEREFYAVPASRVIEFLNTYVYKSS